MRSNMAAQSTTNLSSKYRLLTELGEGGMARVHLAMSQGLAGFNKLVVLKVLKSELTKIPEFRDGFLREARICARMSHPNVVAVNEVELFGETPVIIMEYLQGQSLSALLRRVRGTLSLAAHLRIISDSLSGLEYAHNLADFDGSPLRLVHLDFTPQNIFVTYDGMVKVLDFGIAQVSRKQVQQHNATVSGKLRYMSPEQIMGAALDRRSDVFAAGIVLSEAVAGQRFWGDMTDTEVVKTMQGGTIASARKLNPPCPAELDRIFSRALAFNPAHRYQTVAELQADLESFMAANLPRTTAQDVGRQLASWFEDERTKIQQLIESRTSDETSVSWSHISLAHRETKPSGNAHHSPSKTGVPLHPELDPQPGQSSASRRRAGWRASQALALILVIGAAALMMRRHVAAWVRGSSAARPAETASKRALVRITVYPASASLFIDNTPIQQNPLVKEFPADGSWHQMKAEAPGYRSSEQGFQVARDVELVISMEPEPPSVPAASVATEPAKAAIHKKGPRPSRSPASATRKDPPPAHNAARCSPPYTYDQRGLKHFKPECM